MATMPNIEEEITTKDQVNGIIEQHVPRMLRPKAWPGLIGVDIADDASMKSHFHDFIYGEDSPEEYTPVSSVIIDMAVWYRLADMKPPEDIMYVVFLLSGQTWACTYMSLLGDVARIMLATERGSKYAGSEAGAVVSLSRAVDICKIVFPNKYFDILQVAYDNLTKLRSS